MKEFEDDDPMELQAILMPEGDLEAQARFLIEEFASMGMTKANLIHLFQDPFYTGTYRLYRRLGEERVLKLIEECSAGTFSAKAL